MQYDLGSSTCKGYAVLLAYKEFKKGNKRPGAKIDLKNMKEIAKCLGLEQINKDNEKDLTRAETLDVLKDARRILSEKGDCPMFVFMISTHGEEEANTAIKGQMDHALWCSDGQKIFLSTDVIAPFSAHYWPILKGKPKIFFIQACRNVDPTWHMVNGTDLMKPNCRMHINEDKTQISVVRNIDYGSPKTQELNIDVKDIFKIHTSKNSDDIDGSMEFHLDLKGGEKKEEFFASCQDHAECWIIGLGDLMLPNYPPFGPTTAKRTINDVEVNVGTVTIQKHWKHVLWDCGSSHMTGDSGGAGSQSSADSVITETDNTDETEADTCGSGDSRKILTLPKNTGFTKPLQEYTYTNASMYTDSPKNVILSCEINSPNVKWGKDGKLLDPSDRLNIVQEGFVHRLKITHVQYDDSGKYTCTSGTSSTSSTLIVGDYLAPQKLSLSEENKFTVTCSDGSKLEFQTQYTSQADIWFNILTYVMHSSSYGTDEGVSVKVEQVKNPPSAPKHGTQTSPDGDGTDESNMVEETDTSNTQPGSQSSPDVETEADVRGEPDSGRMLPPPTRAPIQVSEEGRKTNTEAFPVQESGNQSIVRSTLPKYNPDDTLVYGKILYINDPIPRMVKNNKDTLVMSAVPSGMLAWRSTSGDEPGSWLITCVKNALIDGKKKYKEVDFISVLTTATCNMTEKKTYTKWNNPARHEMVAVPVIEHQLLKKLIV